MKLWTLNRVLRRLGFVLVVSTGNDEPTRLYFQRKWKYDSLCARMSPIPALPEARPRIVCLCGSTRFMDAFQEANLRETIAGRIVLSIGCNTKSDADLMVLGQLTPEAKAALDELHKLKIDLADEILVLNVGGYIGSSTRSEIEYADRHGKPVRYLEAAS